jgi:hypothetical protein
LITLLARLALCLPLAAALAEDTASPTTPAASRLSLTLEDLYSDFNVIDASISPSGKTIAATVRTTEKDALVLLDLATGKKVVIAHFNKDAFGKQIDVRIGFVMWKTEDRLLFQLQSHVNEGLSFSKLSQSSVFKLGNRLYAVNRDGKNLLPMFGEQYEDELVGAFDTSDIASMLWNEPGHILMQVGGWEGRSLFKVDVNTGRGKLVERQKEGIVGWWFDVDGKAVVREEYSVGTLRYYRKLEDGKWKKYYSVRRQEYEEQPIFDLIGPSSDPGKFYVLARPPGKDRIGVYLYDLSNEKYSEPLQENATYDIATARSADDGSEMLYHCYDAHVRICDFADPKKNAYMRGLRKFFDESANVYIVDTSKDENTILRGSMGRATRRLSTITWSTRRPSSSSACNRARCATRPCPRPRSSTTRRATDNRSPDTSPIPPARETQRTCRWCCWCTAAPSRVTGSNSIPGCNISPDVVMPCSSPTSAARADSAKPTNSAGIASGAARCRTTWATA